MRTIPFDLVVSIGNGSFINLTVDWNDTSYDTYSTENETPPFNVCPADSVSRSVTWIKNNISASVKSKYAHVHGIGWKFWQRKNLNAYTNNLWEV